MSDLPSARALPRGFRFAAVSAGLKKRGHTGSLDVALIVSDAPTSVAAVFTQNLVQAPPVILSRAHVHASPDAMRALRPTSLLKRPVPPTIAAGARACVHGSFIWRPALRECLGMAWVYFAYLGRSTA